MPQMTHEHNIYLTEIMEKRREIASLKSQLVEAHKDRDRLNWLDSLRTVENGFWPKWGVNKRGLLTTCRDNNGDEELIVGDTIREALDAAMEAENATKGD